MPEQALYLKWRPRMFEHVIGQEHITHTLRNALIQGRIRHAYLFNGPRGTGKTTMARILAKAVNCLHPEPGERPCDECRHCNAINEGRFLDLIEIDAASHNGVDDVRDLRDKIAFAPTEGQYKVYIIDEVHRFSGAAFDALLKTLEEPPDHAIFILATTELDKVPATIRSRSLIFEFRRVSFREVADRLELIAQTEQVHVDRAVLELIAQQGTGSVRDSISLLDQLIADPEDHISLEYAERVMGTAGVRMVGRVAQALIENDAATGLTLINQAVEEGADPGQFGRQIVEYLRNLLLIQTGGPELVDTSDEMRAILSRQANAISRAGLIRAVRAFNAAVSEVKSGWQPQLPLELAMVESTRVLAEPVPEPPPTRPAPSTLRAPITPPQESEPPVETPTETKETTEEPTAPPVVSLSEVVKNWNRVLQLLRKENNIPLSVLLEKGVSPVGVEGSTLTLRAIDNWVVENLNKEDKKKQLIGALYQIMRVRFGLRMVTGQVPAGGGSAVDDTIMNDPVINGELKTGGKISRIDQSTSGGNGS